MDARDQAAVMLVAAGTALAFAGAWLLAGLGVALCVAAVLVLAFATVLIFGEADTTTAPEIADAEHVIEGEAPETGSVIVRNPFVPRRSS